MVCLDAGFLSLLLYPGAKPPNDLRTGAPVTRAQLRVERLIEELTKSRERIVIPCPALAEFLVLAAEKGPEYLAELHNQPSFYIQPFDERSATELAAMEFLARKAGSKRGSAPEDTPWQKVKYDRQIVAIARVRNAHTIYSDDRHILNLASDSQIKVVRSWELKLAESDTPLLDDAPDPLDIK